MAHVYSPKGSIQKMLLAVAWLAIIAMPLRASGPPLKGHALFSRCAACHLQDGQGIPGAFPPLAARLGPLLTITRGRDYLVLVVQNGLMGNLEIGETTYQGVMPGQGTELGDEGVAAVLNYLLTELNRETLPKGWRSFTGTEVAQIRARYPNLNNAQLQQLRADVVGAMKK